MLYTSVEEREGPVNLFPAESERHLGDIVDGEGFPQLYVSLHLGSEGFQVWK